jgi:hypothetical protein
MYHACGETSAFKTLTGRTECLEDKNLRYTEMGLREVGCMAVRVAAVADINDVKHFWSS